MRQCTSWLVAFHGSLDCLSTRSALHPAARDGVVPLQTTPCFVTTLFMVLAHTSSESMTGTGRGMVQAKPRVTAERKLVAPGRPVHFGHPSRSAVAMAMLCSEQSVVLHLSPCILPRSCQCRSCTAEIRWWGDMRCDNLAIPSSQPLSLAPLTRADAVYLRGWLFGARVN